MAIATNTHAFEITDAQSQLQTIRQSRGHTTIRNASATTESAIHACQRRTRDQTRRAKQHAHYRDREATVVQRSTIDGRSAEADVRDRRGEVV